MMLDKWHDEWHGDALILRSKIVEGDRVFIVSLLGLDTE